MRETKYVWGVSEAMGTILLLVSSTIAGAAILTFVMNHPASESISVERFYSEVVVLNEPYIAITHTSGKPLELNHITVIVSSEGYRQIFPGSECQYNTSGIGVWDGDNLWEIGECFSHNLTSVPSDIEKIEVRVVLDDSRGRRVVYSYTNSLLPPTLTKPDLVVEDVFLERYNRRSYLLIEGSVADIKIVVSNRGAQPLLTAYIQLFLYLDGSLLEKIPIKNSTTSGDGILGSVPYQLSPGESITFIKRGFSTTVLGSHIILARVLPALGGEAYLFNNENYFRFNVTIQQFFNPGEGPNPAVSVEDIFFSNRYPKKGETITITVYVKNLGPSPVLPSHHLLFVMSLYPIRMVNLGENRKSLYWTDDIPEVPEGEDPQDWASTHGQDPYGNDTTFPTVKIRNFAIPASGRIAFQFRWSADIFQGSNIIPLYFAVDCNQANFTVQPVDQIGTPPEEVYTFLDGDKDEDNLNILNIQVTPKILVVDDDGATSGTEGDRTTVIIESLSGAGITPDLVFVASQVRLLGSESLIWAPKFDYPQPTEVDVPALQEYDVIIWVVGNNPTPVLYNNLQDVKMALDNYQNVWIIGRGVLPNFFTSESYVDLSTYTPPDEKSALMRTLLYDYTYLKDLFLLTPPVAHYYGVEGDNVTDLPLSGIMTLNVSAEGETFTEVKYREGDEIPEGALLAGRVSKDPIIGPDTAFVETGVETDAYRILWSFFDLTTVIYLNERINLVASVLKWFGWEIEIGDDLAIVRMEMILPEGVETPKYMDDILLRVWVRNNGPTAVSTTVCFYVIGEDNLERRIPSRFPDGIDNPQDIINIPGRGGQVICEKTWRATLEGTVTFRVVVDPFHVIQEINEKNNDISYSPTTVTSLVIEKRILLVDDDESYDPTNLPYSNWDVVEGTIPPPVYQMEDIAHLIAEELDRYNYAYDIYTVKNVYKSGKFYFSEGPSIDVLMRYTSVIWVLPENDLSPPLVETLVSNDTSYITQYLTKSYEESAYISNITPKIVIISGSMLTDLGINEGVISNPFLKEHLAIDSFLGRKEFSSISGSVDDDYRLPFHGLSGSFWRGVMGEAINPREENPYLTGESAEDVEVTLTGVSNEQEFPVGIYHYSGYYGYLAETITLPFQLETNSSQEVVEMFFGLFRDLGLLSNKPDMVARTVDINVSEEIHQLGDSYLVKGIVANLGGVGGSCVVRIYDGNLTLKTDNLYLPPGGVATLEVLWIPTLAGMRHISIRMDYYNDLDETFEENNNPWVIIPVYFFYDDLEGGTTTGWEHESTIVRINGENALEFLDETQKQYTKIVKDWSEIGGFVNTTEEAHSAPLSFWSGREPPPPEGGTRAPDVVGENDRYLITEEFSLKGALTAKLTYYQKYQMDTAGNGGVILVGTSADGVSWKYRYVIPMGQYSGNINLSSYRYDDYGRRVLWAYNGVSAGGRYDWEKVSVDLTKFVGIEHVKIMFLYISVTWGNGEGWFIDDVEVKVSRKDSKIPLTDDADQ
ncbi:MAG: hypothetical protein J7L88_05945 [Thermoplasmata archaeon]|nr:hypothetical protein [Thermoplasmata archaeon]